MEGAREGALGAVRRAEQDLDQPAGSRRRRIGVERGEAEIAPFVERRPEIVGVEKAEAVAARRRDAPVARGASAARFLAQHARARLLDEPFDEGFPYPAWEDIETAWRLTRKGLRIVYQPRARVAHDHPTSFRRFAARQEKAGYCAVVFRQRHPELGGFVGIGAGGPPPLPSRWRQRLLEGLVRALLPLPVSVPRLWEEALRFHYIRGLRRGWRELIENRSGGSP